MSVGEGAQRQQFCLVREVGAGTRSVPGERDIMAPSNQLIRDRNGRRNVPSGTSADNEDPSHDWILCPPRSRVNTR